MLSIDNFKSNISIVRPNLFYATITLPPGLFTATEIAELNNFKFRCESTELPGRTIATYDDQSTGTTKKLAYDVTYNDINMTIIASEDMHERKIFESWIDRIVLPSSHNAGGSSGGIVRYYEDYAKGIVTISQLDSNGSDTIAEYKLHYAYPIQVGAMNLNWSEFDTYQRFAVTLTYRYYTKSFF